MREHLEAVITQALQNSKDTLGTIERNTEIKVVYLTLWALGWDPVSDIACNFHVHRFKFQGGSAKMAKAVDFAVRDSTGGICLLGEVKQWSTNVESKRWEKGKEQILKYQQAINIPRAFLTNGSVWLVFDGNGKELPVIQDEPDAKHLINRLAPYLMKGNVPSGISDPDVWKYGICPPCVKIK
jgi:predicted type IV restriction endonuclease